MPSKIIDTLHEKFAHTLLKHAKTIATQYLSDILTSVNQTHYTVLIQHKDLQPPKSW